MLNGKLRCDVPALHTLRLTPRAARGSMLQTNVVPMSGGGVRQRAVAHLRAPQPAALVAAPPGPGATRMTLRPTHPTRVWHSLCFAQKPPEPSSHSPATLLSDAHFPGLTTRNLVPHTILIGAVPEATRSKVSPPPASRTSPRGGVLQESPNRAIQSHRSLSLPAASHPAHAAQESHTPSTRNCEWCGVVELWTALVAGSPPRFAIATRHGRERSTGSRQLFGRLCG